MSVTQRAKILDDKFFLCLFCMFGLGTTCAIYAQADFPIVSMADAALYIVAASIPIFAVFTIAYTITNKGNGATSPLFRIGTFVPCLTASIGAVLLVNGVWDYSPSTTHRVKVVQLLETNGDSQEEEEEMLERNRWRVGVTDWRGAEYGTVTVAVSRAIYKSSTPLKTWYLVETREGLLGIEWVASVEQVEEIDPFQL